MKMTRAVVPSLFTVLNMLCGFMSITASASHQLSMAAWLIILGAAFDSIDGLMARLTKSSSAFGVEFDSLSDVVSFGAAPSMLVYQFHLHTWGGIGVLIGAMPLVFGGIRLARFNIQLVGFTKEYFSGLPIPTQAMTICAFALTFSGGGTRLTGWHVDLLAPLVIILSLLMVTTLKYDTMPEFSQRGLREHPMRLSLFILACVIIVASQGKAFFPIMLAIVASGPLRWVVKYFRRLLHPSEKQKEEDAEISRLDV
jgi:CDP-diacylglycerol--serine O-phosphatidyltransferase